MFALTGGCAGFPLAGREQSPTCRSLSHTPPPGLTVTQSKAALS